MPYFLRKRGPGPVMNVIRWSLGTAAMVATWTYGVWKGGYAPWLGLPVGVAMLFVVAAAFSIPEITLALMAVAFIAGIDSGLVTALRNTAVILVVVGLGMAAWNAVRWLMRGERGQRRS